MFKVKALTFRIALMSLLVLSYPMASQASVQDWTHEFSELDAAPSIPVAIEEQFPSDYVATPWDVFVKALPNSKFIKWGLSWVGVSPYEKDSTTTMSPASVQKILTSTTALRVLGPDFRFSNSFQAEFDATSASVSNVEFSVSGDPTWAHPAFGEGLLDRMKIVTDQLVKAGVKKVTGAIAVRLTQPRLETHERPEQWKQSWLLACYATLPSPVILNGNCATFKVSSSRLATWQTTGVSTPLDVQMTKGKRTAVEIAPVLDDYGRVAKYEIRGTFASTTSYTVPVQNNIDWLKNLFLVSLKNAGIAYEEVPAVENLYSRKIQSKRSAMFVDLSSKTLREILPAFLQESINLIGDRLYLEVAYQLGSVKTDEPQLRSLVEVLKDVNAANGVVALDGSGLIAANQIAAQTLRAYLGEIRYATYFKDFLSALPVSGISGTLRSRLNGALTKGKVFAKTGTIDGVANLAGYFLKDGSEYEPFVVLTRSNLAASTVRAQMDKVVVEFARQNVALP